MSDTIDSICTNDTTEEKIGAKMYTVMITVQKNDVKKDVGKKMKIIN